MKYTITIDCDDKGKLRVSSHDKNIRKEDIDRKRVLEAKVRLLVTEFEKARS